MPPPWVRNLSTVGGRLVETRTTSVRVDLVLGEAGHLVVDLGYLVHDFLDAVHDLGPQGECMLAAWPRPAGVDVPEPAPLSQSPTGSADRRFSIECAIEKELPADSAIGGRADRGGDGASANSDADSLSASLPLRSSAASSLIRPRTRRTMLAMTCCRGSRRPACSQPGGHPVEQLADICVFRLGHNLPEQIGCGQGALLRARYLSPLEQSAEKSQPWGDADPTRGRAPGARIHHQALN